MTEAQRNKILKLLKKYEELFYGTLGTWKTDPEDFKLKKDANPIVSRPHPVTKVHKEMLKKEVEYLFLLGVIERENNLEWGYLSFIQIKPKTKSSTFSN